MTTPAAAAASPQARPPLAPDLDQARLQVDADQLGRFYDLIFRYADDRTFISLRCFDDDAPPDALAIKIRGCRIMNGCRDAVLQEIVSVASFAATHPKRAVFAPPVVLLDNPKTAKEEDIAAGVALSVELDQKPTEARTFLEALLGPATVVVASGGTWTDPETGEVQDRQHVHWRLSEPTSSAENHARLKEARRLAAQLVGADETAISLVHPLRWPGSWHRKAEPKLARILAENPDAEIDLGEALELLGEAWGAHKGEHPPNGVGAGAACPTDVLHRLAETIPNPDLDWNAWNVFGMAFWAASGGSEEGLDAFRVFSAKSKKHGTKSADGAAARWAGITRSPPTRIGLTFLINAARRVDPKFPDPRAAAIKGDARYDFSHDGLALDMGRQWQSEARHVALWGRWMYWTGCKWATDETLAHMTQTRDYLRERGDALVRDAQAGKLDAWGGGDRDKAIAMAEALAKNLRAAPMVANVVGLARSNVELVATSAQWDADPFLLGTPDGTVDLRTGALLPAHQADYITKMTAVAPAAPGTSAPLWTKFLQRITKNDAELQAYLQRFAGYSLTGSIQEHAFAFGHGGGANGKSVYLNTVAHIMGDYALTVPTEMLMVSIGERHPTELARLRGVRLAIGSETEDGRQWAESKIKSLTGGDPIAARFMRQDFFEFVPQFKLFIVGNHKPSLRNVDEAIQRRLHFVPFTVTVPAGERDPQLPEKLKAEWPAILRWMIDGCLAWQQQGLNPPKIVTEATVDYLTAEDAFSRWADDAGYRDPHAWEPSGDLWASWKRWAEAAGEFVGKQRRFSDRLGQFGLEAARSGSTKNERGYRGFRLTDRPNYTEDTRYGS